MFGLSREEKKDKKRRENREKRERKIAEEKAIRNPIVKETGLTFEEMCKRFQWAIEAKQVCLFYDGEWRLIHIGFQDADSEVDPVTKERTAHWYFVVMFYSSAGHESKKVELKQLIKYCKFYNLLGDKKVWDKRKRELATIWVKNNRAENKEFDIRWEQIKAEEDPYERAERIEKGRERARAEKEIQKPEPQRQKPMSKKEYQKDKRKRAMAALAELNAGKKQENTTEVIVDDDSLSMSAQLWNILIEKGHMKRINKK